MVKADEDFFEGELERARKQGEREGKIDIALIHAEAIMETILESSSSTSADRGMAQRWLDRFKGLRT